MVVVRTVLVWLAIILGVCWLLLKILGNPNRHDGRDREDEESHNTFRK